MAWVLQRVTPFRTDSFDSFPIAASAYSLILDVTRRDDFATSAQFWEEPGPGVGKNRAWVCTHRLEERDQHECCKSSSDSVHCSDPLQRNGRKSHS